MNIMSCLLIDPVMDRVQNKALKEQCVVFSGIY